MQVIAIDGSRIEYRWFAPKTEEYDRSRKPPVVLLHHGFGCVADWKTFPQLLAQATGHPVLAYSRRGCGSSSPPLCPHDRNYLHEEANSFLPLFLHAMNIKKCHLYGHSDGATIALLFAANHHESTISVVAEAPHVFAEDVTIAGVKALAQRFATEPSLCEKLARHHRDPQAAFEGWSRPWLSSEFEDWTIKRELSSIVSPLLVIQGLRDPFGTTAHAHLIKRHVARTTSLLELPDTGHTPHFEAQAVTLDATTAFLLGQQIRPNTKTPKNR